MAWRFRRSSNIGPFRINFSGKGIGWSVGVRGARWGKDATGRSYTHVSIPGTGIYSREYQGNANPTTSGSSTGFTSESLAGLGYLFAILLVIVLAVSGHWVAAFAIGAFPVAFLLIKLVRRDDPKDTGQSGQPQSDVLYAEAVRLVLDTRRGTASLIQRHFDIDQSRAQGLLERMHQDGIVGPDSGEAAREVLITLEAWESRKVVEPPPVIVQPIALERFQAFWKQDKFREAADLFREGTSSDQALLIQEEFASLMVFSMKGYMKPEEGLAIVDAFKPYSCRYSFRLGALFGGRKDTWIEAETFATCARAALLAKKGEIDACFESLRDYLQARDQAAMEKKHIYEYCLAHCLLDSGRRDHALEKFQSVDRRYPGFEDAAEYVVKLNQGRRRSDTSGDGDQPQEDEPKDFRTKDPFEILGVSTGSSPDEIKAARNEKIKQCHPDMVAGLSPEFRELAERKSKELNWAYQECMKRSGHGA